MLYLRRVPFSKTIYQELTNTETFATMYRPYLVTYEHADEFVTLIKNCEKPLYAMSISMKSRLGGVLLSRVKQSIHQYCGSVNIVLIPMDIDKYDVPIYANTIPDTSHVLYNYDIKYLKLYNKDHLDGYVDTQMVLSPMDLFEKGYLLVQGKHCAGSAELGDAIWKSRSSLSIISEYLYYSSGNQYDGKEAVI